MLLQFSVGNFRSFKDKAVLSFEASADQTHQNHIYENGRERVFKTLSVFGANASGKSNLFRALTAAILLIRQSNSRQVETPLFQITPFLFFKDMQNRPSSFEFVFLAEGMKYVYGFSATRKQVIEEYLYKYRTSHASTVFVRNYDEKSDRDIYHFTNPEIKRELSPLIKKNTPNKLFLATATSWNSKETRIPYLWFSKIDTYSSTDYDQLMQTDGPLFEQDETEQKRELHNFICKILHEADINIKDYQVRSQTVNIEELIQQLPPSLLPRLPVEKMQKYGKKYEINMIHEVMNQAGEIETYLLPSTEESQGTQSLFLLSPLLKNAFEMGKILCIDEFDTSLHPMLVTYLVSLFNNPEINKKNAQLLISTHTTELLSLKVSRRDEIYFVEKNQNTGESELYSLDEFSPRKNSDTRKAYLLGRYGAVPDIGSGEILW